MVYNHVKIPLLTSILWRRLPTARASARMQASAFLSERLPAGIAPFF